MKVGYARVSTKGQTPENQISKLAETGCELFFEEKTSGAKSGGQHLKLCWNKSVGVTSLDRLARSTPELLRIAEVFIKRTDTYMKAARSDRYTNRALYAPRDRKGQASNCQ